MTHFIQNILLSDEPDEIVKMFLRKEIRLADNSPYLNYFCTSPTECPECHAKAICMTNYDDNFSEALDELNALKKERIDKYPENYI